MLLTSAPQLVQGGRECVPYFHYAIIPASAEQSSLYLRKLFEDLDRVIYLHVDLLNKFARSFVPEPDIRCCPRFTRDNSRVIMGHDCARRNAPLAIVASETY